MTGVLPIGCAIAYNRGYGHCTLMSPRIGTLGALVGRTTLERAAARKHGPFIFVLAVAIAQNGSFQSGVPTPLFPEREERT